MDIILQLGGNPARSEIGIELAKAYPDAKVVISTFKNNAHVCHRLSNPAFNRKNRVRVPAWAPMNKKNFIFLLKMLGAFAVALMFPITRPFMIMVLPLGFAPDDIIVIFIIIAFVLGYVYLHTDVLAGIVRRKRNK